VPLSWRSSINVNVFELSALVFGAITNLSMLLKLPTLPVAATSVQLRMFE
jgi:hypothetical protein